MIKSNQHILNRLQVLIDAGIVVVSYILAWYLRFESGLFQVDPGVLSKGVYFAALAGIVPGYLALYGLFKLYEPRRTKSRREEFGNIIKANSIGLLLLILILYLIKQEDFSRQMLLQFYGINIFIEFLSRYSIRYVLWKIRRDGFNQKHIVIVGNGRMAKEYLEKIHQNPQWGYQVMGMLTDIQCLKELLEKHELDEVVIALGMHEYEKLERIVDICETAGVHTKFIMDYGKILPTKPQIEDVQGIPVIHIRKVPLKRLPNRILKRGMDLCGAMVAIVIFSPVMLFTAISIKLTTKGTIIFKQERVGKNNRKFYMYKFRSMIEQDEESEKKAWTVKNDPRVTTIGRFIRKTSIDELPQLFNVLKGEMSLVGPRPERPQFVEKFKYEIPRYMVKHQVLPGITGWAQINGYRGDTSIEKRIEHDLYYIENWTIGLDFKIIIYTLLKGFMNDENGCNHTRV